MIGRSSGLRALEDLRSLAMGRGGSTFGGIGWAEGSRLPARLAPGSGVDERVVSRVLAEFGLPIDGNPPEYRAAYRLFLPDAADQGVQAMLRDARRRHDGQIETGTPEEQIEWLAQVMRIAAPDGNDGWWRRIWDQALSLSGLERGPRYLSEPARLIVVARLASEPPYTSQLPRALADAIGYELRLRAQSELP